uniref:Uncharacterized protein n=1 Tax=Eptatretus burgeri TaxID=7764 RepID=A0A8C4QTU5_EPTBU
MFLFTPCLFPYICAVAARIHLDLDLNFTRQYKNHSSPQYKDLSTRLEKILRKTYEKLPGFQRVNITGFSEGSVIAYYDVISTTEISSGDIVKSTFAVATNLANANFSIKNIRLEKKGIVKSPSSEVYEVGNTLTFSCSNKTGVIGNASWFKENTSVSMKGNWDIKSASFSDSGSYRCEINSGVMTFFESVKIVILERHITTKNLPNSLTHGSSGNISCCLSDEHDPTLTFHVTWHNSDDTIIKQGNVSKCTSLLVNNVDSDPKSIPENYKCTFFYRDFNVSDTIKVGFYVKVNMSITPERTIKESDTVILTCLLPTTIANPTITWMKDDEIITDGTLFSLFDDEDPPKLEIKDIKSTHEGNYSCIAKKEPMTYQGYHAVRGIITMPRIIKSTSSFTLHCNDESRELQCCVASSQNMNVTWRKDNFEVHFEAKIKNNCSSYKPQKSTSCPQSETISCLFRNIAGNDEETTTIYFLKSGLLFSSSNYD